MDIRYIISDVLSIITISLCLILKIPQIINLYKVKNPKGLNIYGLLLELSSYTIMTCYNFCNGYALLSYMEYPIILVQEIILIYLVVKYMGKLNLYTLGSFGLYLCIISSFLFEVFPKYILSYLAPLCTPVSASSKIVQLIEIVRSKDSESVSVLTWFLSAFTNMTRIYTIYMDSADITLLINFSISTLLSTSIMIAAIHYKHPRSE